MDRFVADALSLVGYSFTTVFSVWNGQDGIKDPEIISWCQANDTIWVHADDSAKRDHAKLILASQIRTVWVYRRDGKMSGADQLRALAFALQEIMARFRQHQTRRHYKVTVHGQLPHTAIRIDEYEIKPPPK